MELKHIDPAPPTDLIKKVFGLLMAGQFSNLELWGDLLYIAAWSLQLLRTRTDPDDPIFGVDPVEAEFCEYCAKIYEWADGAPFDRPRVPLGAWMVKAMLIGLLRRLAREMVNDGLPDWLADITEQIEAI